MQTTKRRSAQAWREMVGRFTQSGLTEEGFCEREGVSAKLFHRWRSKRSSAAPRAVTAKAARVSSPTAGFVDLGPLKGDSSRLEVRLDLGGGALLHVVRG